MNRVYVSIRLDASTPLYVGELLGFSGCHSHGASLKGMLENLAQAIELVDSHLAEVASVYFDMDYPDPAAMACNQFWSVRFATPTPSPQSIGGQ